MKKTVAFALMMAIACLQIPTSSATHISKPVVVEAKAEYVLGEKIAIRGWVNYNEEPTPNVLLNFKVIGSNVQVDRSFPSDEFGYFTFELETKDLMPGRYDIVITSQCLDVHRQICTHQSQTLSITLHKTLVPDWIKSNAKWWSEGTISDGDFVQGIQYLIKNNIIVAPRTVPQETGSGQIPSWIKSNAGWWSEGRISDSDFLSGIQYMIQQGIIKL